MEYVGFFCFVILRFGRVLRVVGVVVLGGFRLGVERGWLCVVFWIIFFRGLGGLLFFL